MRAVFCLLVVGALVAAQEKEPRSTAADYPAHVQVANGEIGAEYLVHSIPAASGSYLAKEYVVIDVGIFPRSIDGVMVSSSQFTLRINHGKAALYAQSPGMVAASLKYPDWEQRPTVMAGAGVGDGAIVFGPPRVGRFPGDPSAQQSPVPPLPRAPEDDTVEKAPPMPMEEAVSRAALPEGHADRPVKGYLFFPFKGKTKAIRSLELEYEAAGGVKAKLSLF